MPLPIAGLFAAASVVTDLASAVNMGKKTSGSSEDTPGPISTDAGGPDLL